MPELCPPPEAEKLEVLSHWVRRYFGISYGPEQQLILAGRVAAFCAARLLTLDQVVERLLDGEHDMAVALAEALSTNHTHFFREPEVLSFVGEHILPQLRHRRDVRIWSAACSSGDEAYTLAIMLLESWGPTAGDQVALLGTDISQRMVSTAEQGIYSTAHLHAIPVALLRRYFRSMGLGQFSINSQVRSLCAFRRLNLNSQPWPFQTRFQLIFLRNVLYYFDEAGQRDVLRACYAAAEPGAWLVTSLTEPVDHLNLSWQRVAPAILRKPEHAA